MKKSFVSGFIAAITAAAMLLSFAACNNAEDKIVPTTTTTARPTTTASPYVANPLTGIVDLPTKLQNTRPVAVMINNIAVAQSVQTGLNDADMVFETMVEGGITRLMAVYSDISKVDQIGTVRSARYSYAELARGLDARYVHCGSDNKYATPLMNELDMDHIDLGGNGESAAKRISNGLAYEHTLYTYGDKLQTILAKGRTEQKTASRSPYVFNSAKSPVKYEKAATDVKVFFSSYYKTTFEYEKKTGKYIRGRNGDKLADYKTDKYERFTNVIIMYTDIYAFADNQHMKSELDSGSGMYITNGSCTAIKWSKGDSSNPLKFTDTSGKALKLNAGNSYICITDSDNKSSCTIK